MPATESVLNVRGGKLLMRRAGSGPPLLFLHGSGGATGWLPFYEQLSKHHDLLVPDHPSFGRSPTPEWLDDIGDMAYFYLDLLAELGLQKVHVVGHSLGGWIALEMAVRSTQRFADLTLIASAGIRIKGHPIANFFIMTPPQLVHTLFADKGIAEQMLARVPTPEEIDEMVRNSVAAARLGWSPRFFNPKLAKWLHRIDVPTQILWGDKDQLVPPVYAEEFHKLIPGSSVTMIAGAGHVPQIEKMDETASAIINFAGRNA